MSASEAYIALRGGPTLPAAVLCLAWSLQERGIELRLEGGDLLVHPRDRLTDEDRQGIRRWRPRLIALVDYVDHLDEHLAPDRSEEEGTTR